MKALDSTQETASTPGVKALVRELLRQVAEMARDYGQLATAEAREKAQVLRSAGFSLAVGGMLLLYGFFFLTVALIALIAWAINSWGWASLIVGGAWAIIGGGMMLPIINKLRRGALRFNKLSQRVQKDKEWVKTKLAA